jgi:hypothetical protein
VAATSASLDHRGGLRLRARGSTLTLTSPRLRLGRNAAISARIGGRRRAVFTVTDKLRTLRLDAATGTARLSRATITLTRSLSERLRLRKQPAGTVSVDAALRPGSTPQAPPDNPRSELPANEPPVLARPPTAIDLASATITWHPRGSFIQYINAGEGTRPFDGATGDPPTTEPGSDAALTYTFHFPFKGGWYDPPSGVAGVRYRGAVNFSYRAHSIDLTMREPEIELDGGASRAIFRFASAGQGERRGVLVNLDPSKAKASTVSPDGKTHILEQIPGTIPEGTASSVFGGFYLPGDQFGWISVSFTTA